MAEPDALTTGPTGISPELDDDAAFDAAFPDGPKVTAEMSDDQAFDTMFPDKEPRRRGHVGGNSLVGAVADLIRPMSPEEWANYLENAPAGRVITAFGNAFKGDGISQETAKWMREHGIFQPVAEKDAAQNDSFGQAIMRPLVTQARWLNQLAVEPLIQAFDYGLVRPIHATMQAIEQVGQEAEAGALKPLQPLRLARDIAGMVELETTRGEIAPGVARPPARVAEVPRERVEPTLGDAAEFFAVPEEYHEPLKGFAQQRLAQLDDIANGTPERAIPGPDGKPMTVPAKPAEFLTPEQRAEREYLRKYGDDPAAIFRAYEGLADQLQRQASSLPPDVAEYRANAVIGESEQAFMGLETPSEEALAARRAAAADIPGPPPPRAEATPAGPVTPPTPDEAARIAAPDLFREYDALSAQRTDLAQWQRELRETTEDNIEAKPPKELAALDAEIAAMERKIEGLGARRLKGSDLPAQLDALVERRADMLDDLIKNHPDMTRVREAFQKVDERMRDLAPEVSRVRREAWEQAGTAEHVAATDLDVATESVAVDKTLDFSEPVAGPHLGAESLSNAGEKIIEPSVEPRAGQRPETVPPQAPLLDVAASAKAEIDAIVTDRVEKLVGAGRPREVAQAEARIMAAFYETWSQRMGGKLGSAREMYDRDAPGVQVGRKAVKYREAEMAQSNRGGIRHEDPARTPLDEGRKIIRLAKTSDASTFMHETSHAWLGDVLRYAEHPDAPAQVKADAETIQKWLGVKNLADLKAKGANGKFTKAARAANEKFARGWERYLMEGVAPSKELAGVFAKFRAWLTQIYRTLTALKSPINDDIRAVFDRFLTTAPERTMIAEEGGQPRLADILEHEAETIAPADAAEAFARGTGEFDATVRTQAPELVDELKLGPERPSGEGEEPGTQRTGPDGGGNAAGPEPGASGDVPQPGAVGARAGKPGQKGFGPPQPEKLGPTRKSGLYARVPKRPPSLADWIKARGGVKDQGGEITALGVRKPGLIKDTGENIDDLALYAGENGFFPELGGERPTVAQFLAKLDDDLHGRYQWSEFDDDAVQAYRDAIAHNAEVDRLAAELDIKAHGMSHQEFWDTVAERMSLEKASREIESQAAAAEKAMAEAEEAAGAEFVAEVPDQTSRTLEDLENENRQAEASRGQIQGTPSARDGGDIGPGQGEGEGGAGPFGRGVGARERTDAEIRKEPEPIGSDRPFEPGNPELIDKAGNFNFNNFTMAEDVRDAVRASVARNNEFIDARRGVITDTQQLELADAIGMTPEDAAAWQAGQAANAEELLALGKMSIDHSKVVSDLSAKAARTGDPADLIALGEAMDRQDMIVRAFSSATAESGRTLRAHQLLKRLGVGDAGEIGHLVQANTGRTLDELFQAAQTISKAGTNPSKVAFAIQKMRKATWVEVAAEVGQAVKLWSPKTWIRNVVGNTLALASEVPTHAVTAAVGAVRVGVREALGLKAAESPFPTDIPGLYGSGALNERAYFSEILPGIFGIMQGSKNGLRVAKMVMQDEKFLNRAHSRAEVGFDIGVNEVKSEARVTEAVPGKAGTALRGSFRLMSAMDAVAKGMAYEMKLNQLAARTAVQEGLSGMDLTKRVAELTQNPTIEMMAMAKKYSDYATFNQDLTGFLKSLQAFRSKHPSTKFVLWFLRTPVNILKFSAERSVFAPLVKEARENLMGKNGVLARDEAIARIIVGSTVSYAAWQMAEDRLITGNGPKDMNRRRAWLASGKRPYSFKWFGRWVSYAGYEPIATLFGVAADANEIKHHMSDEDGEKVGQMMAAAMAQNFTNKTYMSSLSDFVEAVNDPVRYGENWAASFLAGFVPSGVKQVGQAFDPYLRETRGVMDKIMDSVGLAQTYIPPKVDILGDPIKRGPVTEAEGPVARVLTGVFSPGNVTPESNDPIIKAMNRVEYFPDGVDDKINGVKLTPEQQYRYATVAGKAFKMAAQNLVSDPGFGAVPAHRQRAMLMERMSKARDRARSVVIGESRGTDNDIAVKAKELKTTKRARLDARP